MDASQLLLPLCFLDFPARLLLRVNPIFAVGKRRLFAAFLVYGGVRYLL